ncbi:S-adenosyl-L-methionine-dependent methyltransferase [Atractiella rhizophila]|nr:S-adenosyl-L-methionine-dependent methyltransferase [Atractiella rhizophila]
MGKSSARSFSVFSSHAIRRLVKPLPKAAIPNPNPYTSAVYEPTIPVKAFTASKNKLSSSYTIDHEDVEETEQKNRENSPRWEPEDPSPSLFALDGSTGTANEVVVAGRKRKREEETHAESEKKGKVAAETAEEDGGWVNIEQRPIFCEIEGIRHASRKNQVAPELQKYWYQRYRLFSLYDYGVLLDHEGWYSVTPEAIAKQIAERCRCGLIIDAYCGVGGNAIQFAFTCERVLAFDISPLRLALARHNATIYGVADRIEFICADFLDWITCSSSRSLSGLADVIFLSPPWGGIDYLSSPSKSKFDTMATLSEEQLYSYFPLDSIGRFLPIGEMKKVAKDLALFLPRNTDLNEVRKLLGGEEGEELEVEEEWMGEKLKALTVYTSGLLQPVDTEVMEGKGNTS